MLDPCDDQLFLTMTGRGCSNLGLASLQQADLRWEPHHWMPHTSNPSRLQLAESLLPPK